ncbi:MAG: LCP family protein [Lachnospiraceae bacterium]
MARRKSRRARRKSRKSKIIFAIEMLILLLVVGALFVYGQVNKKANNIQGDNLDLEKVEINEDVVSTTGNALTGYTNIALFALDSRENDLDYGNSDTIIIATINNDTKEVRLASVYRDTLLDIGDDTYLKANAAYAYGSAEQALSMLNTNLDLNITDYVTVNFNAVAEIVDLLGGVTVEMTDSEVVNMNDYCVETSEKTGKSYTRIEPEVAGTYDLNGVQAVSYARIRYGGGDDYKRTERQRHIIQLMVNKAKSASLTTLSQIMDTVFPMIKTTYGKDEIFSMGSAMLGYNIVDTTGFPQDKVTDIVNDQDSVIPVTLASNVTILHQFLYPGVEYTPSQVVLDRSAYIESISGYGLDYLAGTQ